MYRWLVWKQHLSQVTEVQLSCYLVLLSVDSKTRYQDSCTSMTSPISNINTFRPEQNGHLFEDNIFKLISWNYNNCILNKISLKYVPKCVIDDKSTMVLGLAWHHTGAKPLPHSIFDPDLNLREEPTLVFLIYFFSTLAKYPVQKLKLYICHTKVWNHKMHYITR